MPMDDQNPPEREFVYTESDGTVGEFCNEFYDDVQYNRELITIIIKGSKGFCDVAEMEFKFAFQRLRPKPKLRKRIVK